MSLSELALPMLPLASYAGSARAKVNSWQILRSVTLRAAAGRGIV